MSKRKPYIRPMAGWWKKNPFYVEYMIHEATALFVTAYAFILLFGLVRLTQGQEAWEGWLAALKSPASIVAHLVLFVAIFYHAFTWFKLFPLTMPPIMVGGKRLAPEVVVGGGWLAGIAGAIALFAVVWGISA